MAFRSGSEPLDLPQRVSANGALEWVAPGGSEWTLHAAGRRLVSAEAATWLGEHFRTTLAADALRYNLFLGRRTPSRGIMSWANATAARLPSAE